jgi:Fe-S cluster assembly protein SufB
MDDFSIDRTRYDNRNEENLRFAAPPGLTEDLVRTLSAGKGEPSWMLDLRLRALDAFRKATLPTWGPDLSKLDLAHIRYFLSPDAQKNSGSWQDVPKDILRTFEALGIPEAERTSLAGVGAQYESEVVYHHLKEDLQKQGIVFLDLDVALQTHEELVRKHFLQCVPMTDHPFMLLHAAVWSGGTFLYVPKGVKVDQPLQAYFRMNAERAGQFEHTLIIIEEGAQASYIEGCSAPRYEKSSLHAGCVELFVGKGARLRYASVENWSSNTYNLNTKRAIVEEDGVIEWIGGNLGAGTTMLYPCSILKGDRSRAEHLSISLAAKGQDQDTGAKVIHLGRETRSTVVSKSISVKGGKVAYRGLVSVHKGAAFARSNVECDSLIIGSSRSETLPLVDVREATARVGHEARVGRIGEEQLFYLRSRGLDEETAIKLIIAGFIEPITKELPLEYAAELNKLISMEMEGSVG